MKDWVQKKENKLVFLIFSNDGSGNNACRILIEILYVDFDQPQIHHYEQQTNKTNAFEN